MKLRRTKLDEKIYAEQKTGIGSGDAAAILGYSKWSSPFQVWERLVGEAPEPEPEAQTVELQWALGQELEHFIARLYTLETGRKVRQDTRHWRHRTHRWMVTHLDFRVLHDMRLLEIKTARYKTEQWGEPGTAEIPINYWVQTQHEMAVTGYQIVDVPVLFLSSLDFAIYTVPRAPEFIDKMIIAESDFWHDYVVPRVPPPVDGSEAARKFMHRRWPKDDGLILPATPEQSELVDRFRLAEQNVQAAERARNEIQNKIIDIIGEATGLRGGDFEITYKATKEGKPGVNWEGVASTLRKLIETEMPGNAQRNAVAALGLPREVPIGDALDTLQGVYATKGKASYRKWYMKVDKEES